MSATTDPTATGGYSRHHSSLLGKTSPLKNLLNLPWKTAPYVNPRLDGPGNPSPARLRYADAGRERERRYRPCLDWVRPHPAPAVLATAVDCESLACGSEWT